MRSIFKKIFHNLDLIFFYFFILSIPLETKLVFLTKDSYFTGSFVHYTTFFLYLSDIFFILVLFFWSLKQIQRRHRRISPLVISSLKKQNFPACIVLQNDANKEGETAPSRLQKKYKNNKNEFFPFFKGESRRIYYILFFFLISAILSLFLAKNRWIGFYQVLKLSELILLFILTGKLVNNLWKFHCCLILILFTGFTQAIISVAQYLKQENIGLKWLGEPILNPNLDGVAKIVVDSEKVIRVYGTFPHPNVLAGFLLLSLFISLYFLFFKANNRRQYTDIAPSIVSHSKNQNPPNSLYKKGNEFLRLFKREFPPTASAFRGSAKKGDHPKDERRIFPFKQFLSQNWQFPLLITLIIIQSLTFILTFSRTAWLAGLFSLFWFIFLTKIVSRETSSIFPLNKQKIASLVIIFFIISCFLILLFPQISTRFELNVSDQAISDRFLFNSFALEMIKKSPFFGLGMGNFVLNINPVRNIPHQIEEKSQSKNTNELYNSLCLIQVSNGVNNFLPLNKGGIPPLFLPLNKGEIPPLFLPLNKGEIKRGVSLEPWQYQPVHNLYLLIAAEIGIIGLILFIFFIFKMLKMAYLNINPALLNKTNSIKRNNKVSFYCHNNLQNVEQKSWANPQIVSRETIFLLSVFLGFLFIGFFDHYFWTIQQGQLIFWLTLGLLIARCRI